MLLVGAMLIRLTVTDAYQRYVRTGMGPLLLTAGILLVVAGGYVVIGSLRRPRGRDPHPEPEHDHEHGGEGVGWLLLAPVVALLLVSPPALGSFAVDRTTVVVARGSGGTFQPLPTGTAPRSMTLLEFDQRAMDRDGASFAGAPVRLTGFVARTSDGPGFRLARYQIACCAADAVAAIARVVGVAGAAPARDSWVTVTGTFGHVGTDDVPEIVATSVQQVTAPVDPYE